MIHRGLGKGRPLDVHSPLPLHSTCERSTTNLAGCGASLAFAGCRWQCAFSESALSLQSQSRDDQPGMGLQDCLQMEAVPHNHSGLPEVATKLDGADGLVQRQVVCCH